MRAPVGERGGSGTSISQSGGGSSGTFSWDQAGQMRDLSREFQESDVEQNKLMAVLSYFSLLVLLPILCAKDSKYARFHANQGLMLLLVSMGWQFISAMLNLVLYHSSGSHFLPVAQM